MRFGPKQEGRWVPGVRVAKAVLRTRTPGSGGTPRRVSVGDEAVQAEGLPGSWRAAAGLPRTRPCAQAPARAPGCCCIRAFAWGAGVREVVTVGSVALER